MKTRVTIYLFLMQFTFAFGLNNLTRTTVVHETNKLAANQSIDSVSYFGNSSCWTYEASLYEYVLQGFRTTTTYGSIQGDTVLNNHRYLLFHLQTGSPYLNSTYPIRQENKKIYMMSFEHSRDYLIYDFDVKKGDTIHSTAESGYISRLPIVSSVDSVQLYNGEYRKRIKIYGDTWIEGIGSVNGFNYPLREFVTCDCNSSFELIAFAKEKTLLFYNAELCASFNCCQGIKDELNNIQEQKKLIDVHISPTKETITITFVSNIEKCNFQLFDLQGKVMVNEEINETNHMIHLNQLPRGIYLYKITTEGKSLQTGKLSK